MLGRLIPLVILLLAGPGCGTGERVATGPSPSLPVSPARLGDYRLTFTAASNCSLPEVAKQRTFEAWIWEQSAGSVRVDVRTNVTCWGCSPGFNGTRSGNTLSFVIKEGNAENDESVVESVGLIGELSYVGTATATQDGQAVAGTFSGAIRVIDWSGGLVAVCNAPDHKIEFVPR